MSETPKKLNLDAALREWPEVEKPAKEWDDRAEAVVARLRSGETGASAAYVSDENLFIAPLGQTKEDGHNSAALAAEGPKMTMADRERDRRSLQDLAKLAQTGLTPPPPSASSKPSGVQPAGSAPGHAKGEDSGLIDLRAVGSDPAPSAVAQPSAPAPAPGLASQGLFDEEPVSQARPAQPAPSLPPMPASVPPPSYQPQAQAQAPASIAPVVPLHPATASQSQPAQVKKGNGAVIALVFGGIVALGAAAAGTFFYLKTHKPAEPVAATETKAPDVAPAPPPATATVAAQPTEPAPAAEPSVDPNALPTSTPDSKLAAKGAPRAAAKGAAKADTTPAPEAPKPEAKLTQKDLPADQQGPAGDLGKAMGAAVGDTGKKEMKPAADTSSGPAAGTVPQKPSQGAITGAIGAVLPAARVCLGPDDPVSHASIVFGSDGHVTSVTVTGAAQGKMAEGCIKDALMRAKVAPFAEPSYSTRITVRHQ